MSKIPEEVLSGDSSAAVRAATPHHDCPDPIHHDYTDPIDSTWVITSLPTSQSENSLEGETSGDSQASSVVHRGAVGETTDTPTDRVENSLRGKTLGESQAIDTLYRGAVEETADSPITQISQLTITSPATSTPGSTPISHRDGKLKESELQESEESMIGSSVLEDDRRQSVEEDDDIVVVKMIRPT